MFIVKMKLTNLNGLTNSTNDLFTLSDALRFEYQTAEPSWRRGFWGVSVKRANGLLRSCQFEPIRSQLRIASLPVGSDLNIKQADCKPPTQKKCSCLLFSRWWVQTNQLFKLTWKLTPRRKQKLCNPAGWIFLRKRSLDSGAQTIPAKI